MLPAFKQYLSTLKLSPVSRKLYLADVHKFLTWLGTTPTLKQVSTPQSYLHYQQHLTSLAVAPSMLRRTSASLRQFGQFLAVTYSLPNPTLPTVVPAKVGPNNYIKHFTNYLNTEHLSPLTIKSYKSDVTRYYDWVSRTLPRTQPSQLLNDKNIEKYLTHLSDTGHAISSTIERKAKSLKRFQAWYSNVYSPNHTPDSDSLSLNQDSLPLHTQYEGLPNTEYVSQPDQSFFSVKKINYRTLLTFAILLLFTATLSIFGYRQFSRDATLIAAYPNTPVTPNRQLSFQGRLENAGGTPITTATNFVFKLWDDPDAGEGNQLYTSGTCSITPDSDGVFSTQIGSTCGSGITSSVFTENANVYLEVTVVADVLTPRQQIATVAYALNSETLQGFPISATVSAVRNTVVPMNQWGEILIGEQSPRMRGISGTFAISAPALSLTTTTGSNGNITLAPDGTGQVNVNGNTTSTNFFNVSNAQLTTGSLITGTAANNNSGFKLLDLLSGSSPTTKFSVSDAGNVTLAGDLTISGGNVTSATTFDSTLTVTGNFTSNANTTIGNANTDTLTINAGTSGTGISFGDSSFGTCTALETVAGVLTCGSDAGGSTPWDDIGNPTDNLTLTMAAYNSTFNWDPGPDAAETNFSLTTQGEDDTSVSGDNDQVLLALSQTSNGVDVTQAADALLTLTNSDANDPVVNAIRFDAGAAGTDFTYGINFDAAAIGTAELLLQNGETIDNTVDGTILLTAPIVTASSALTVNGNTTLGDLNTADTLTGNLLTSALTSGATTQSSLSLTASSLTTGSGFTLNTTSTPVTAASTSNGATFNFTEAPGTNATTYTGLDINLTDASTVAGNTEKLARFALNASAGSPTDNTISALLSLENNDTITGNQISVTDGLIISGAAAGGVNTITDAIDVSDDNLENAINVGANTILGTTANIDFTNFTVDDSGNVVALGDITTYGRLIVEDTAETNDIYLQNEETIDNDVNGTITFGRDDAGTVTLTAKDNDATAALTLLPGGAAALTLGGGSTTAITLTTDGTGNGEVVLPNDSIGTDEILSTGQTDEYCLTYETGDTFEWQTCGGSPTWNSLSSPTGDLTLTMAAYNSTFNWDPGPDAAETNFSLTTQGEDDTSVSGDNDQVLLALSQTSNGVDVTQAADALLTLTNSDANDPVVNAIRFDAGAAGTDFTYGINFDAAAIGTAELVFQNGETLDNVTDGTVKLAGIFAPTADDTYDLGSTSLRWKDLYLGGETLHIGTSATDEGTLSYTTSSNVLSLATDSTGLGNIILAPGGTTALTASGNDLTAADDLAVNGNTTLGNAITDTLTFTARVAADADLLPIGTTGTNDLGSSSLPWDNLYLTNLDLSAGAGTLTLKDNTASAYKIVEGANTYLDITTTDDSETFSLNLPTGGATLHTANLFTANIAQTINLGTGTAVDTINIGTGGTGTDDINIGGLATSHLDITGIINLGGTTYKIDASGTASNGDATFHDLIAADTGNPGLTVGDGSIGFTKVGGSTISDNSGNLLLDSDTTQTDINEDLAILGGDLIGTNSTFIDLGEQTSGAIVVDASTDIILDADGADIFFKDAGTTIATLTNTTTDLTVDIAGDDLIFADGDVLSLGRTTWSDVAYNAIGDTVTGAIAGVVGSDDDLYIEGNLQVDGVISGDATDSLRLQAGGATAGSGGTSSIYFLDSTGDVRGRYETLGQFGDGGDGSVTFSSSTNCQTTDSSASIDLNGANADCIATALTAAATAGVDTITVASTTGFVAGDQVIVAQMVGTGAGNFDILDVESVPSSTSIVFDQALKKSYQSTSAQMVRIPQYTDVTVNSGFTLNVSAWDGTTGGILAFKATGTVTVQSTGLINLNGLGGAGGTAVSASTGGAPGVHCDTAAEANSGSNGTSTAGNNGTGPGAGGLGGSTTTRGVGGTASSGGGGSALGGGGGGSGGGGAGGSYFSAASSATAGATGGAAGNGTGGAGGGAAGGSAGAAGTAGSAQGDSTLSTIFIGSGGGSGGNGGSGGGGSCVTGTSSTANDTDNGARGGAGGASGAGGAGGGIIIIAGTTIANSGTISADGVAGSAGSSGSDPTALGTNSGATRAAAGGGGGGAGGGGGGGSGGTAWLIGDSITGNAATVALGAGGNGGSAGGNGGICSMNGTPVSGGGGGGAARSTVGTSAGTGCTDAGASGSGGGGTEGNGSAGTAGRLLSTTTPDYGTLYTGAVNTTSADLAENYVSGEDGIEPGDVVTIEPGTHTVIQDWDGTTRVVDTPAVLFKARTPNDPHLFGVVSTEPGLILGATDKSDSSLRAVALTGRVPVKIDPESAPIQVGDMLTSSDKPGMAKKSVAEGLVIGKALEPWTPRETGDRIMVFVGTSWYNPTPNLLSQVLSSLTQFSESILANLRTDSLQTATISPLSPGEPIILTGPVHIRPSSEAQSPLSEPLLIIDGTLEAATISARVAKFDTLEVKNIVADHISVGSIDGLEARIASLSAGTSSTISDSELDTITTRIKDRLSALTGDLPNAADLPVPESDSSLIPDSSLLVPEIATSSASLASADIDFATINDYLAVIGQATITDIDVTSHLYTSNISSKTGLLALGDDALMIDDTGTVTINHDLIVKGKLVASELNLGSLKVFNEAGETVATIDASGSASLASLTTNMITIASPAVASSSGLAELLGSAQSNATAGNSVLLAPNTELTISSPFITPDSLVYLTPTGFTDNKVLFVKAKDEHSFTVGIDAPTLSDIPFNWWIIQLKSPDQ